MSKKAFFVAYSIFATLIIISLSAMNCGKNSADFQSLLSMQNALVNIAEQAKPAVVSITARNVRNPTVPVFHPGRRVKQTYGTGFIFRKDGYILTNDHVVDSARRIDVTLLDARTFKAKLIGFDPGTDVAVIKIDVDEELPTLQLANSDDVKTGQFALAIGNPFRLGHSVTTGVVSGKGRDLTEYPIGNSNLILYHDFIQTDAWINKGNSGGPLLNIRGEVVGMNSVIRTEKSAPLSFAGAGFAVSSNMIKKIGEQLILRGRVSRGWLGISMRELLQGVKVIRVHRDTPADRAGLQRGDFILEYNGQKIGSIKELKWAIGNTEADTEVAMKVRREKHEQILRVIIGEMPPEYAGRLDVNGTMRRYGLVLHQLTPEHIDQYAHILQDDKGVVVQSIKPDGLAAKSGIKQADLILEINGENVETVEKCIEEFEKALKDKKSITLLVKTLAENDKPTNKTVVIKYEK